MPVSDAHMAGINAKMDTTEQQARNLIVKKKLKSQEITQLSRGAQLKANRKKRAVKRICKMQFQ